MEVFSLAEPIYIHLPPGSIPPEITPEPSKFVVVVEAEVSYPWQKLVSEWMLASGCLYMMAWGRECSTWDDSVDWANIDTSSVTPIPENASVATTWHEDETLEEVFWFSKKVAEHSCVDLVRTVILDISTASRAADLLSLYEAA